MSTSVVLPALGESVTEGTVTRWLKNVGDTVNEDEGLLEISTDKVDTEIPSPVSGVLEEILVAEDETVEVGAVLARIGDGSGAGAPAEASAPEQAAEQTPEQAAPEQAPADAAPAEPEPAAEPAPAEPAPAAAAESAPVTTGSAKDIVLPELGESVTEGTVTRWLKSVGDAVEVDEPLLEISTDKVDTEIPSPFAGVLVEILVGEDDTVDVGSVLGRIGESGAAPAAPAPAAAAPAAPAPAPAAAPASAAPAAAAPTPATPPAPAAPAVPAPVAASAPAAPAASAPAASAPATPVPASASASPAANATVTTPADDLTYVTPLVRRLAQQQGVDLSTVTGTGVGGRIRKEDVLRAAEARSAQAAAQPVASAPLEVSPLRGTSQPMTRLRKVLAERAVASMQQTAQLTTVVEVDVTVLAGLRDRVKEQFLAKTGDKLSFLPFFALAAAEALQAFPIVNATVEGDQIVYPASENLSIAVDTERGLLTPVVHDAGSKTIAQIAHEIADLAARTRDNKLKPDELAGGTFTLTNTGSRGALFDTPVVFLPQSAILGTGVVVKRPGIVTVDGVEAIAVRSYVYLALSYDHRIIDGADAARFLAAVRERLEAGAFDADLGI